MRTLMLAHRRHSPFQFSAQLWGTPLFGWKAFVLFEIYVHLGTRLSQPRSYGFYCPHTNSPFMFDHTTPATGSEVSCERTVAEFASGPFISLRTLTLTHGRRSVVMKIKNINNKTGTQVHKMTLKHYKIATPIPNPLWRKNFGLRRKTSVQIEASETKLLRSVTLQQKEKELNIYPTND